MINHYMPSIDRTVSRIGFGCASLGSRISGAVGVNAVRMALDSGVRWFDVAPPYGDGQAEHWLGKALGTDRHKVVICSKFGIQRPNISPIKTLMRPLARALIKAIPSVRTSISRARSTGYRPLLNPEEIEKSVTSSLRELSTDYIDVLALHEPSTQEVENDEIRYAMQRLVTKGMVKALSVAGDEHAVSCGLRYSEFRFLQFPDTPFKNNTNKLREQYQTQSQNTALPTFITHGVFGSGLLEKIINLPQERKDNIRNIAYENSLLDNQGNIDWPKLLLAAALANNNDGIVIASMFSPSHAKSNCQIAGNAYDHGLAEQLHCAVNGHMKK